MPRIPLAATLLLFAALSAHAGTFTTIEGLEYARPAGEPLLLDLRIPDGPGRIRSSSTCTAAPG